MINVKKSQPAPVCLTSEKKKASGSYKCGDVLERIQADFHNKCYLCEQLAPTDIHVEHFIPHKGDIDLKFDWANLFFCCSHCNTTKGTSVGPFLNVTETTHLVDSWISYKISITSGVSSLKERVELEGVKNSIEIRKTRDLLDAIYNGAQTPTKRLEAGNLRQQILKEIQTFHGLLKEYRDINNPILFREDRKRKIIKHLHPGSAFTAFKRWIIRNNETLMQEFGGEFS